MKSKKIRWSLQLSAIVMCIILLACFPMPALVSAQSKVDVLFEGTVNLPLSETFTVTTYNSGAEYAVKKNTPLGALQKAADTAGFTYEVTDKKYADSGVLLLDNVGSYRRKSPGSWYAYVNGVYKDEYVNPADGLNVMELENGDRVEFYYAAGIDDPTDINTVKEKATAAVKIVVSTGKSAAGESAPADWTLQLSGAKEEKITKAYFEEGLACQSSGHQVFWTDKDGNVWGGVPLWLLIAIVDDNPDQGPHHFNFNDDLAAQGYEVNVISGDGWKATFDSADIARNNGYIVANTLNGKPLPLKTESGKPCWPLQLKGPAVTGGQQVGNIVRIELSGLPKPSEGWTLELLGEVGDTITQKESGFETAKSVPQLRIVKYAEDRTTIVAEKTIDYLWMERNLEVIGDGEKVYRFEGVTFDPNNLWDPEETYPSGFKIENAVKGTRIRDLCELVGGMGAGTEVVLVAKDGYETRLPYSSIYPDPWVQARQGDAILAWWADGKYVPEYADGMRLFFTPKDGIYGQWDMHETLPEKYWHYYYSDGVQYPSCAGLSAKWITEIRVYSVPESDWKLKLDGRDIGGMEYEVSKTYFEQALACQFGANHRAAYTDSKGRVWEGMPLWLLVGFVDDADQHSDKAFNDALAKAGYKVIITAADGYSVTIDSRDIIRNNNYIVANTLNGTTIPESSSDWPLRLVGPAVKGSTSISKIVSIRLVPKQTLTDIAGHWAGNNIKELFVLGAISGYPDGTFRPDKEITRAEFATILVKALKLEQQSGKVFGDTAGHWAKDAIATVAHYGIVRGYDANTFRPDDFITREQMAAMIVRAVKLTPAIEELSFTDSGRISGWAKEAVATAVKNGIMKGYPDNTIRPQAKTTRAEAVTVIVNALKREK